MATGFVQRFKGKIKATSLYMGTLGETPHLWPVFATITPTAGASTVCNLKVQMQDASGNALPGIYNFDMWLSDAATGAGLTGTTASGGIAAVAASGVVLTALVASKLIRAQTKADGSFTLAITDSARTLFYPCMQTPGDGQTVAGAQLITGNYG